MTTPTNWPDPKRPGVPTNPDVSGWHWVIRLGEMIAVKWDAPSKSWRSGNHSYYTGPDWALNWEYCSPVLTPAQIAEMLAAERNRCAEACEERRLPDFSMPEQWYNNGCDHCSNAIRNLGAAP